MTLACGIDVGTSAVKSALFRCEDHRQECLALRVDRIRRRAPLDVVRENFEGLLSGAGVDRSSLDYVATTGDSEGVDWRDGHFYSMTTHARGGLWLVPEARCVVDVGALHSRAIAVDERGRVLDHKMTSQCASGSGQFLENISRYLGITLDEIGPLSCQADDPEPCSSICAVLAETDVINMVSRGLTASNILKGIHLSMAGRLAKLLRGVVGEGTAVLTGGLGADTGLVAALVEILSERGIPVGIRTHENGVFAGAVGAALWGAFRHERLAEVEQATPRARGSG